MISVENHEIPQMVSRKNHEMNGLEKKKSRNLSYGLKKNLEIYQTTMKLKSDCGKNFTKYVK